MEAPSSAEITARLERATESVLSASSVSSYCSGSKQDQEKNLSPSLSVLLSQLGPPDAPHCPKCTAFLPFGEQSRFCLACAVPLQKIPRPIFTSSAAYQHLLAALKISGVETNEPEPEEDLEFNTVKQDIPSSFAHPERSQEATKDAQTQPSQFASFKQESISITTESAIVSPSTVTLEQEAVASNVRNVHQSGDNTPVHVEDYSKNLNGISLEDFFTSQTRPTNLQESKPNVIVDHTPVVKSTSVAVRKDSLFWDPLSDSIIPDGHDLVQIPPIVEKSATVEKNDTEEDDEFAWDADFQSAEPTMSEPSTSFFETQGSQKTSVEYSACWFDSQGSVQAAVDSSTSWFDNKESVQTAVESSTSWFDNQGSVQTAVESSLFNTQGSLSTAVESSASLFDNQGSMQAAVESPTSWFESQGSVKKTVESSSSWFESQESKQVDSEDLFANFPGSTEVNTFQAQQTSIKQGNQTAFDNADFFALKPAASSSNRDPSASQGLDLFEPSFKDVKSSSEKPLSIDSTQIDLFASSADRGVDISANNVHANNSETSQEHSFGIETNDTVQSLVGQLHDLSFMLSDELVLKREGKSDI